MDTFSHIILGRHIMKYIKEQNSIILDSKSFLLGSILPDFKIPYLSRPHQNEYWEDYLKRQFISLAQTKTTGRRFGREYSLRLGIICHFYTDFFCYPHNCGFDGSSREHLRYEWALRRYMKANVMPDPTLEIDDDYGTGVGAGMIYGIFEWVHRAYAEKPVPSYRRDIRYALRACIGAVTQVALISAEKMERASGLTAPVIS